MGLHIINLGDIGGIRGTLQEDLRREFELVEGVAHKRLRDPKVIKEDGAIIFQHFEHLTNKLTLAS